ncbi:MAG: ATP-dependent Clp protease proteolytic subunit [Elusimicrobia bacterium]|nr:ATP-dependent Clp protease proteolytic subunit [Elusimicrobiota bacterium]
MRYIRFFVLALSASVLASVTAAAQMFPGVSFSTAPPSPEKLALEKIMTENALERERNLQRLKKLTDERDELQIRSMALTERQRLETADLDGELKKLSLQNSIASEKERLANAPREGEYRRLSLELNLGAERNRQALSDERQTYDKLSLDNNLTSEHKRQEMTDERTSYDKLALDNNLASERLRLALAPKHEEAEKLRAENELKREQLQAQALKDDAEKAVIDLELKRLDFKSRKLKYDAEEAEAKTVVLKTDLDLREKKEKWKAEANREPDYLKQPFDKGRLTISDRRIPLNGPIIRGSADFVTERIEYFNNKSEELPIFIVIDNCPGGSVMEGYRIVKAMRASKAPIHVIVKSFAASMAAVITTLAPHSYAYPNAVILHHQMSSVVWGNMTVQKEQLEINKEWYRRLAEPVAEKMGTSVEGMVKEMYKHNSEGNWEEFADKAQKLKWVDTVVHEIRETGVVKEPDDKAPVPKYFFDAKEEVDPKGQRYVSLPRLEPFDFYYIYNPDSYYR